MQQLRTVERTQDTSANARLLYRVAEAANLLAVSRTLVYEMVAAGQLGAIRLPGGSLRIPADEIRAFCEDRRIGQKG